MKVAVVGAGGVGGFLGVLLARAGHQVRFFARGAHLAAIRERGLQLRSAQFGDVTADSAATDDAAHLGRNDLVIVSVKMYDLVGVRDVAASALAPDGVVLPVQNGLDAPDLLAAVVGPHRVVVGTAAIEAMIEAPGIIAHAVPMHWLTLGELSGPAGKRLESLSAVMREAEITVKIAADGREALWEKAALIIPFATITAAADCALGDIWNSQPLKKVFNELSAEAMSIAAADGCDVQESIATAIAAFEKMLPAASALTSSMNRDFQAGRRNELEWLTGKLIQVAGKYKMRVPTHDALYSILKLRARRQRMNESAHD